MGVTNLSKDDLEVMLQLYDSLVDVLQKENEIGKILEDGTVKKEYFQEGHIYKNIFNFYRDKTIIFISHRLNNCDLFNHIIEMKEGKIIKDESI